MVTLRVPKAGARGQAAMPEAGGPVVVAWSRTARIGAELRDARALADRRSTDGLGIDHPHRRNPADVSPPSSVRATGAQDHSVLRTVRYQTVWHDWV